MSKTKKISSWVKKHTTDPFVKKSIKDNYRSRAAYKLIAINKKYNLLNKINTIADLGCAPGSWLQVLKEFKNIKLIVGIDLLEVKPIEGVVILKQDIADNSAYNINFSQDNIKLDLVLSDIAPNITGISDVDQSNFAEIAINIVRFCNHNLKPSGALVMKYFLGSSFDETLRALNNNFKKVSVFKPESSKKKSNEVYLICNEYKA